MVVLGVALDPRPITREVLEEIVAQATVQIVDPEPVADDGDFLS